MSPTLVGLLVACWLMGVLFLGYGNALAVADDPELPNAPSSERFGIFLGLAVATVAWPLAYPLLSLAILAKRGVPWVREWASSIASFLTNPLWWTVILGAWVARWAAAFVLNRRCVECGRRTTANGPCLKCILADLEEA